MSAHLFLVQDRVETVISWFGATMFQIIYGIEMKDASNEHLRLAEESLETAAAALVPGRYWVDFMPFLRHIPAWMPGAGFKRKAQEWKVLSTAFREVPYGTAREAWVSGHILSLLRSLRTNFISAE